MKIDKIDINQKMILTCLFLFIIGIGAFFFLPKERYLRNMDTGLRIGSGDDITGLLLQHIVQTSKRMGGEDFIESGDNEEFIQSFEFKDC